MLALGIILVVIVAAAWTVTLLAKTPLWIAIAVSVVAALVFAGVLLFRKIRAARRAAALERELLKQAAHQADRVRPDRRAEIVALQSQMKEAIAALKRSKLGTRGGSSALYALPWYVIVGPPAAGKTTALEKSGLAFASGKAGGAKVRGTAGTRNCDWWFSRDAILLDTAGRFATEDDDREEWETFLGIVRRFRPERPIDGLIVALSIADVMSAHEAQVEEIAAKLRERIDEVMSRLEMVVPVYVLFTKADLVAGFVEFWADYGKAQRAQPWGATFRLDDERLEEPARAFEAEFDTLVRVLHARMLERLAREPSPEVRAKVLQFPVEFQSLRAPLARFMEELCKSNPYAETPIVRGFYFSSGTQTGRPIERMLANMVRGFDLRLAPSAQQPVSEPHSYFVTELFEKIVFPDRDLAVRSGSRLRRKVRTQAIVSAAAVLVMLAVLVPALLSFAENRDLIDGTVRDVVEARRLEAAGTAHAGLGAVDLLHRRVQLLERAESEVRIAGWWGPRTAPDLRPGVQSLYLARLRRVMEGPVREQLAGEVRGIENLVRTDAVNFREAYDQLKLYLMLGNPQRLDVKWAAPRLADVWARANRSAAEQDKLASHASYYLSQVGDDPSWAWQLDAPTVTRAQGRLMQLPLDDLRYGWLTSKADDVPPIRAEKIFFGASANYFTARGNTEVPGLYTALGWNKVRVALESPESNVQVEGWVLGQPLPEQDDEDAGSGRLKALYFQRYVQAWSEFLESLDVVPPPDLPSAITELQVLSEANGPYVRLFRTLSENVRLELTPPSLKEKAVAKGKELLDKATGADKDAGGEEKREVSPVEEHYEPLLRFAFGEGGKTDAAPSGLTQYLTLLNMLGSQLRELSEAQDEPTDEFAKELSRTATSVRQLLGGLDATTRIMLEPLLMNPIRGSRAGVSAAGHAALADRWKSEVWEYWNTTLAPRFPFSKVASDVSVAEFAEFFRPQTGLLWKYFEKDLKDRLEPAGKGFVPKGSADPVPFRPDFLKCLADAQAITEAVFGGSAEPSVPFTVNIHPASSNISEISLIIDGKAVTYRNEPERWQPAVWPGKGPKKGGTLKVRGAGFTDEIPREGEFGLFRLLFSGGIKPAGASKPGVLTASWILSRPGEPPVHIEFKPAKSAHPFDPGFFRKLKCPATIVNAPPPSQ